MPREISSFDTPTQRENHRHPSVISRGASPNVLPSQDYASRTARWRKAAVKEAQMHILLVNDDSAKRCLFQIAQAELGPIRCELTCADRLEEALRSGSEDPYDIILLDFPHSAALMVKTLSRLRAKAPGVPIVLLNDQLPPTCASVTGEVELRNALKTRGNEQPLARAVRYAIERSRLREQLPRLAFLDDLTGLCNRRGFFLLADHHLRMARRSQRSLLLLYVDLDGLKQINDTLGHREGDRALSRTAEVLCTTFRESDVVGRLGGDEFGVLTWEDSGQSAEAAVARLLRGVEKSNATRSCQHLLSLSVGVARFDPTRMSSLEELMVQADGALYGKKRNRYDPKNQLTPAASQAPVPCAS